VKESYIEQAVTRFAKQAGWLSMKFVSPNNCGVPDHVYFKNGETILIEFKAKKGRLSPLQKAQIKRLRMVGMKVYVVDSIEQGRMIFA